jgi:transposase
MWTGKKSQNSKGAEVTTTPTRIFDPVGVSDIAHRLNVHENTVQKWRQRHPDSFPEPRCQVGGRPCWQWHDVQRWARKHTTLKGNRIENRWFE